MKTFGDLGAQAQKRFAMNPLDLWAHADTIVDTPRPGGHFKQPLVPPLGPCCIRHGGEMGAELLRRGAMPSAMR